MDKNSKNYSDKLKLKPNLTDYESVYNSFEWDKVLDELDGLPGNRGLNIAYEAVDRHVANGNGEKNAIIWLGKKSKVVQISYKDLKLMSSRFANLLRNLGVGQGDRVFSLTGRIPELYYSAIGTLKNKSVFCPLFSAFGPEPIYQRLSRGDGKVLITTEQLYRKKIESMMNKLSFLDYVLITDAEKDLDVNVLPLQKLMEKVSEDFNIPDTDPEDMALLHFTSGTTGMPKGAIHVHNAVLTHYVTGKFVMDFHPEDIFWCTADPGWVTGTSYGIIAPPTARNNQHR